LAIFPQAATPNDWEKTTSDELKSSRTWYEALIGIPLVPYTWSFHYIDFSYYP